MNDIVSNNFEASAACTKIVVYRYIRTGSRQVNVCHCLFVLIVSCRACIMLHWGCDWQWAQGSSGSLGTPHKNCHQIWRKPTSAPELVQQPVQTCCEGFKAPWQLDCKDSKVGSPRAIPETLASCAELQSHSRERLPHVSWPLLWPEDPHAGHWVRAKARMAVLWQALLETCEKAAPASGR